MPQASLLEEDFLRRLERLRLVSRTLLVGALQGEHRSRRRGSGVEFADYRPYVAGDDVRHVDWRAYLRLGKLLLRLFEEEGDLPIYLFLDTSRSMAEGGEDKLHYARQVAAALTFVGLQNLDRVHLVAFDRAIRRERLDLRGRSLVWPAFRFLEGLDAGGETDLHRSVQSFFARRRRRGLVVLISDFLDDSRRTALDLLRHLRQDVLLIHIEDRAVDVENLPEEVLLVDSETGSSQRLRLTPAVGAAYREARRALSAELQELARESQWAYLPTTTETPFDELVLRIFRQGRFLG